MDEHGHIVDILVQEHRDTDAAERFLRRLLGHAGGPPERIVTDGFASYGAARQRISELDGVEPLQVRAAARLNNGAEQSHQPTRLRERKMQWFESASSAHQFLSPFSRFCNPFRLRRHLLTTSEYRARLQARFRSWHELPSGCARAV